MKFGILIILAAAMAAAASPAPPAEAVLLPAYHRYVLAEEIVAQADALAGDLEAGSAAQVRDAAAAWRDARIGRVREDLQAVFGGEARTRFESFVAAYTRAEEDGDAAFLASMARALDLDPAPADFGALRRAVLAGSLAGEVQAAGNLLGDLQTWADLQARGEKNLPLAAWLARGVQDAAPPRPVNPLAAAEAPLPEFQEPGGSAANPLEAFAQMRKDRRDTALQEAQAGMQQLALERKAFEEEYAAKKLAAAQAEATAMKDHARKLAAVEEEALQQRQNSWSNRFKRILGSTVSAAVGAFSGGIGTAAGQRAAAEIFR